MTTEEKISQVIDFLNRLKGSILVNGIVIIGGSNIDQTSLRTFIDKSRLLHQCIETLDPEVINISPATDPSSVTPYTTPVVRCLGWFLHFKQVDLTTQAAAIEISVDSIANFLEDPYGSPPVVAPGPGYAAKVMGGIEMGIFVPTIVNQYSLDFNGSALVKTTNSRDFHALLVADFSLTILHDGYNLNAYPILATDSKMSVYKDIVLNDTPEIGYTQMVVNAMKSLAPTLTCPGC